jgi:excisionase family DNA binding protein
VAQSTKEKSTEPELTMTKQLSLDVTPIDLREPLLTAAEAAKMLSVRPSWIADAARSGHLPCVRIGKHVRFLRSDLERWVGDHRS